MAQIETLIFSLSLLVGAVVFLYMTFFVKEDYRGAFVGVICGLLTGLVFNGLLTLIVDLVIAVGKEIR